MTMRSTFHVYMIGQISWFRCRYSCKCGFSLSIKRGVENKSMRQKSVTLFLSNCFQIISRKNLSLEIFKLFNLSNFFLKKALRQQKLIDNTFIMLEINLISSPFKKCSFYIFLFNISFLYANQWDKYSQGTRMQNINKH